MSEGQKTSPGEVVNGLAVLAAILCAFLGYAHGEWAGAAVAAAVAYGGVWLAFHAVNLALRMAVMGVVLLMIIAALMNRWEYIRGLIQ